MTTTTETTYGSAFSQAEQYEGILGYLNGGDYTTEEEDVLSSALMRALEAEVDELLPEGTYWYPSTSGFVHPIDTDIPDRDEMNELFAAAWTTVKTRYDEIVADVLPIIPVEAIIEAMPSDPIKCAKAAGRLADDARALVGRFAQIRRDAIHAATRYATHEEVAQALGITAAAVHQAITKRNAQYGQQA